MIMLTIIGMAIVTAVPRFLPAFFMKESTFKPWVSRWLNAIPFAALGALIFPGIMTVINDRPFVGIVGGIVAAIIALTNINVIFAVIGSIVTVYLLTM
ncbi:AzlD domain-containing protein [Aquisalibacillus elongatus]|uniref:Branched-subunit amino acid transport protein n=1 Tax=Aquisalibacillus elongatus TaxID=485577 RepID=A0A3N5AYL7_9BACI|nr:AzlD domain-containing protein [Aquisalibacillus elongatus]RPF50144.1 branched-subunit amino acid transport protein [Aquisalibacillus elongatus]